GRPIHAPTPANVRNCNNAIPVTRLGSTSGPRVSACNTPRPLNAGRRIAIASGKPMAAVATALSAASFKLNKNGAVHRGVIAIAHQCNENPCGGKYDRSTALNETAAVITI